MIKQTINERIIKTGFLLCLFLITLSCSKNDEPLDVKDDVLRKVGVFGGSVSSLPESETAKNVWKEHLNIDVITCGIGGAGFSSLTNNYVPSQIEKAEVFDIYILWASTNDAVINAIGDFDSKDETTQSGGILKSIEIIKQKNSNALILFFTSLPRFDYDIYYNRISNFVDGQIALCKQEHLPCLNQNSFCKFDKSNYAEYYLEDQIHLNNKGYTSIATIQMEFIRENIRNHFLRK